MQNLFHELKAGRNRLNVYHDTFQRWRGNKPGEKQPAASARQTRNIHELPDAHRWEALPKHNCMSGTPLMPSTSSTRPQNHLRSVDPSDEVRHFQESYISSIGNSMPYYRSNSACNFHNTAARSKRPDEREGYVRPKPRVDTSMLIDHGPPPIEISMAEARALSRKRPPEPLRAPSPRLFPLDSDDKQPRQPLADPHKFIPPPVQGNPRSTSQEHQQAKKEARAFSIMRVLRGRPR